MINSSILMSLFSVRPKANKLRLVSVVGVPLTRVILKGYNSYVAANAKKISSSLKGIITEKRFEELKNG